MTLQAREIHAILEVCEKTGVLEFSFQDLYVKFGQKSQAEPVSPPVAKAIAKTQENIAQRALEAAENALKEDQIADLLIEDPVELERLIRDGELTNDEFTGGAETA